MRLVTLLFASLLVVSQAAAQDKVNVRELMTKALAYMWAHGCTGDQKLVGTYELIPEDTGRKNAAGVPIYSTNATWKGKCVPYSPKVSQVTPRN